MKKLLTQKIFLRVFICNVLFLNAGMQNTQGQMFYIPDANFRNALISLGYGACITGDSIDSQCSAVWGETDLAVVNLNIYDLQGVQAFGNLTTFSCSQNQITTLPALANSIYDLFCSDNQIDSITSLPTSLWQFFCENNHLTSLPPLPNGVGYIDCYGNWLTSLPPLPNSLIEILAWDNQLTSLPALPASLTDISCQRNQLTGLPVLPNSLRTLVCSQNPLGNLPALPDSLIFLDCTGNQLTSIPVLPNTLRHLMCLQNVLTNLPALPDSLVRLWCSSNQLTSLPILPDSLHDLQCQRNQLTSLPELPSRLDYFYCNNNPNLQCLPQLKQITDLRFDSTAVTCLPNYGQVTTSYPLLSSFSLCNMFNTNGCSIFWNISGKSYFDENADCLFNSTDVRQPNMHVDLFKNGNLVQQTFTGGEGYYSFDVNDTGAYEVVLDTSNIPFTVLCPSTIAYNDTITLTDSMFYNNDFALECKTGFDLGAWSIFNPVFRPGHFSNVYINAGDIANFYGAHCANVVSGTVTTIFNGPVNYISPYFGSLTPDNVNGDTLTYNIADFGAINSFDAFNIVLQADTNATMGSQVCFTVSVSLLGGDNNPANNTLTNCFMVYLSFDPNQKEVYPLNNIDSAGSRWLTYTIHFQNTGNAPAEHIYITDTLDANLDLATFQLLAYSHQPLVQILDGGIARFNFPNINLPDSNSNEPASHGYIQYKIKLKNNLTPGTQVSNTAYIYFDFNAPVVTNTTQNTLIACLPDIHSVSASTCDNVNYNFYGLLLSQTGTYSHTFMKADGCDSVIVLSLQVISTSSTNLNQDICRGTSYNFDGELLTQTGIYYDTLSNMNGCDSLITLQLTVTQPDTAVTLNADTLTSLATGAAYQWINCSTGNAVSGATSQTFSPVTSGNYALIVTQNNCTDTSSCYYVVLTGVDKQENIPGITIYPNPTNGDVTVYCPQFSAEKKMSLKVFDVLGQEMLFEEMHAVSCQLHTSSLAKGVYFVEISSESRSTKRKLVVQ